MAEAGELVEFEGRTRRLTLRDVENKLGLCPTEDQFRRGFSLATTDAEAMSRAAEELIDSEIAYDPNFTPDQNFNMLVRTVRLLQVSLDLQVMRNEDLAEEVNTLNTEAENMAELRRDNDQLRQRLQEEDLRDPNDAKARLEDLQNRLKAMRLDAELAATEARTKDEKIADLEYKLKQLQDSSDASRKLTNDLESKLARLNREHSELQATFNSMASEKTSAQAKSKIEDFRHQDWRMERVERDNKALALQNTELRTQLQEVKTENLEVSEKIVLLDEEVRVLRLKHIEADTRADQLLADKESLLRLQDELRGELQEKIDLMGEFEDKFTRQFRSWEEEKTNLLGQIEALKREAKGLPGHRTKSGAGAKNGDGADGEDPEVVIELRELLNEAMEKEVLLLEAYEQLEMDTAKEIDKALAKEREEKKTVERKAEFLQGKLGEEREQVQLLKRHQEHMEDELRGLKIRNREYEEGVYGLPQSVDEIHALKDALYKEEGRVRGLVEQVSRLSAKMEDLFDENTVLRKKAGVGENDRVDISDMRMQKEANITQLRSLNALLERQVADLEEERRKLRMEMKFRAKYHGQAALHLGLTPEQLLLVEQYVEGLKHGTLEEARIVDQLMKRIEFLEVRLSEVMAYADIPPSMRPALSEFDPVSMILGNSMQHGAGGGGAGAGGLANVKAAQVEAIKRALLKALTTLREMRQSLAENRPVSNGVYQQNVEQVIATLTGAEQAVDAILKALLAASGVGAAGGDKGNGAGGSPGGKGQPGGGGGGGGRGGDDVEGDPTFLADEIADALRERLKELARQVADLQVDVTKKDAYIKALQHQKAEVERRFGVPMSERQTEYVPRSDYEDQALEVQGLKEQLVGVLEELAARERELAETQDVHHRYLTKMQTYSDQIKMLYREHAAALNSWKVEKNIIERKSRKLQEEVDVHKAAEAELARALDAIEQARTTSDLQKEVIDTARRMAVVQIKHAKLARELQASTLSERALQGQVEELQEEVRDVSATCRARLRWLEASAEQANRRVESLFRELQMSAPLASYRFLVQRHARLQGDVRRLVEERAEAVLGAEDVVEMRHELVEAMAKYHKVCDENTQLREEKRLLELRESASSTKALDAQVAQDLVSSRVMQEALSRRVVLVEEERDRTHKSLQQTQSHVRDMAHRLAQGAGELSLARSSASDLESRLLGCMPKAEADDLLDRLREAEEYATKSRAEVSGLTYRAQDAERRVTESARDRQRHLAEITTLKAALRDVSARSEQAATIGRLHLEVDHLRSKEGLARNALNRSELERLELEKEVRRLRQEATRAGARMGAHQDQAHWADKQRHEAQAQLEIGLAARTEQWKTRLWAQKLEQLKTRNDAAADGLDLARRRIKKLEDAKDDAEARLQLAQEVETLLKRGASEVVRDAARLNELVVQLRLERGKLQREEVLLREKVHYVERVNAELHELLERYEAEFFQHQIQLEADRQAEMARAKLLQDEVMRLQERIAALLAGGGRDTDTVMDQDGKIKLDGDAGGRLKDLMHAHTTSDRDLMLRQIEALKLARQEAEIAKQNVARLTDELTLALGELADVRKYHNDALARLKEQGEALLYALGDRGPGNASAEALAQMKAVAEVTINELKNRLAGRDKQLADLQALLDRTKLEWLAQHDTDRDEIARLNQALFEKNNASIDNLKNLLHRPHKHDSSELQLELEKLRSLADRRQDEINILRNQLEQKDAAIEVLRNNYEQQIMALEAEIARLQDELSRPRDDAPSRVLADKLALELRRKDERLRKLDAAVKTIQAELAEALKKKADESIQNASWKQQERLEERMALLEEQNRSLLERLQLAQDDLAAARAASSGDDDALQKLAMQIAQVRARNVELETELARERAKLAKLKSAERTVVDLTTGMSIEAKRQIEELQRRVNALERQNQQLKRSLQADDAAVAAAMATGGDGPGGGGGGGAGGRRPGSSGGGARPPGPPPGADSAAAGDAEQRSAQAVSQWEEAKRLNARIEGLKKKLAQKGEELAEASKEADKQRLLVEKMQIETDKQSAVIRDLNDKLKKAAAAPRLTQDAYKVREYVERNLQLEAQLEELKAQLARATQQPSASAAAGGSGGADEDALLKRDAEVFELRLARDQAVAQATRLKARLDELFGPGADVASTSGRGAATSAAGRARVSSTREAELLSTIANLKTALEKATAGSVPTTKYMAEVTKRKDAQRDAAATAAELDKLKAQAAAHDRTMSELQATNAAQRAQLRAVQGGTAGGSSGGGAPSGSQLATLETLLERREREVAELRQAVAGRDAQITRLTSTGPTSEQVQTLREQVSELEAENRDLKNELNAFDPSFFEEIEEMKYERHQLTLQVKQYEDMVRDLTAALGRPLPADMPS